jgi:Ca2+-binding EF-hand superfamily protein
MGAAASSRRSIRPEWMSIFSTMQFTKYEVNSFHDIFMSVDTDNSGSIDVTELLSFLNIEKSLFSERIFAAFDKDGTGRIDFFEFVVSLWKFCALGKESLGTSVNLIFPANHVLTRQTHAQQYSDSTCMTPTTTEC